MWLRIAFVFTLLTACTATRAAVPTATPTIAPTNTVVLPTLTPTIFVAPIPPAPLPSATPTPNATQITIEDTWMTRVITSSDGKLSAVGSVNTLNTGDQRLLQTALQIRAAHGDYFVVMQEIQPSLLGYDLLTPHLWSHDSQRLYILRDVVGDGCQVFAWNHALYQYDVTRRTLQIVVSADEKLRDIALSPDEKTVAAFRGNQLIIRAPQAPFNERNVNINMNKNSNIGGIVWSASSGDFYLTVARDFCDNDKRQTEIWHVNRSTLQASRVPELTTRDALRTDHWEGDRLALITAMTQKIYLYNPATKQFVPK
jgi:hypothetical protein